MRGITRTDSTPLFTAEELPEHLTRLGEFWRGPLPPDFASPDAASTWLLDVALKDDEYHDNFRFAFLDDPEMMQAYEASVERGCCGSCDIRVTVLGRKALVGCNYGH